MEVKKFNSGHDIVVEGKQLESIVIIKQGRCEIIKRGLHKVNMNQKSGLVEIQSNQGATVQSNVILAKDREVHQRAKSFNQYQGSELQVKIQSYLDSYIPSNMSVQN